MHMERTKNKKLFLVALLVFIISLVIFGGYRKDVLSTAGDDALVELAYKLSSGNAVRQIIVNTVLGIYGYIFVSLAVNNLTFIEKIILSFPIAIALWCCMSMILLFSGIAYNKITSISCLVFTYAVICYITRKDVSLLKICLNFESLSVAVLFLALSIIFTSGILPDFKSFDSYYYIMQYGEILGNNAKLSYDIAGSFMVWVGIVPALISSMATMFGYETIQATHYMLLMSMFLTMGYYFYKKVAVNIFDSKKIIIASTIGMIILLCIFPPIALMSSWVISNTYYMVYLVIFAFLIKKLDDNYESKIGTKGLSVFIDLILIWMSMSRAEGCVVACVIIVSVSCLKNIKKWDMLLWSVSISMFQVIYLTKLFVEQKNSQSTVVGSLVTGQVAIIMCLALAATCLYSALIDKGIFRIIRENVTVWVLGVLIVGISVSAIMKFDLFVNNIDCVVYNLSTQFWNFTPLLIIILTLFVLFACRMKINYIGLVVSSFVLANFLICMFRPQPLRYGYGDSYNRILMSSIPIWIMAIMDGFERINSKIILNQNEIR